MPRFHTGHLALLLTATLFGIAFIFQRHSATAVSALTKSSPEIIKANVNSVTVQKYTNTNAAIAIATWSDSLCPFTFTT